MHICISKAQRRLWVFHRGAEVFSTPVAFGWEPMGAKTREGDGRTPEGIYHICLMKPEGKYGQSLGLDYPSPEDACLALKEGRIDPVTSETILSAHREKRRPPWGTALGGEIFIHGGGTDKNWTQGCIALNDCQMAQLFALGEQIEFVEILPE